MTTLYIGKFLWGAITPSDDIASLHWLDPFELEQNDIMEEHRELFLKLLSYLEKDKK